MTFFRATGKEDASLLHEWLHHQMTAVRAALA
jgi:hypothetical protein